MRRLVLAWSALRSSFWFLPYLIVGAFIIAAVTLTHLRPSTADLWLSTIPDLFSVSAAGARDMLATIAASMIAVVGVVFSMTLVALALASSQYSPRVLRTFMRSRLTQAAIGVFTGLFAYCLIVLRGVRGQADELVVPVTAVSLGVVGAVAAVGLLIVFIHHIAVSIQAATVLASISDETIMTIENTFPETGDGCAEPCRVQEDERVPARHGCQQACARRSGYIHGFDQSALVGFACTHDVVLRMQLGVGQFAVAGAVLIRVEAGRPLEQRLLDKLAAMVWISAYRTVEQDPAFGIRQIVDVSLKALSPGINDTTTAVMGIDYLGAILAALAARRFPASAYRQRGALRLVTVQPDFGQLLAEAFDEIRRAAGGNVTIMLRIVAILATIAEQTETVERRRAIAGQLDLLGELCLRTVAAETERSNVSRRIAEARRMLPG